MSSILASSMPTPVERIATLEAIQRDHDRRIEQLEDNYNGGGDVEYARSVRGRLHSIEGAQTSLAVVTRHRVRVFKGWQASIATFCALVVAAAAVVSAIHVLTG